MTIPEIPEFYQPKTTDVFVQDLTIYIGLVFDGVLDGELLEQKYREFVVRWPTVGGKLVTSTTPYSYTTGHLADVQSRKLDVFLASVVPAACVKALSQHSPTYMTCNIDADSIYHFNNMTRLGAPHEALVSLRITTLKDATLLGFCMSHAACDGTSSWDIIRYYCDFVNGLEIPELSLPPDCETKLSRRVVGEDKDFPELAKTDIITDPSFGMGTGAIHFAKFLAQSLWKAFGPFREPDEQRFIYLPIELVQTWVEDAQTEVDRQVKAGTLQPLTITKNDVIAAWFNSNSFKNSKLNSGCFMGYAIDLRPYYEQPDSFYLKSAFVGARIYLPSMSKLQSMSVPEMALYVHQNVQAFTQPSVVRATMECWEEIAEKRLRVAPAYDIDAFGFISSWTTFRFDHLNLRGALKNKSVDNDEDTIGTGNCTFTQPWVYLPGNVIMKQVAIVMKDKDRGYWIRSNNSVEAWKAFE